MTPIYVIKEQIYDAILIDDDILMHQTWQLSASAHGKKIKNFTHPSELISEHMMFSADTPVYIDSNLGNGLRGEIIAEDIYKSGFRNIYLTTGCEAHEFPPLPCLKGVVGKMPPWI